MLLNIVVNIKLELCRNAGTLSTQSLPVSNQLLLSTSASSNYCRSLFAHSMEQQLHTLAIVYLSVWLSVLTHTHSQLHHVPDIAAAVQVHAKTLYNECANPGQSAVTTCWTSCVCVWFVCWFPTDERIYQIHILVYTLALYSYRDYRDSVMNNPESGSESAKRIASQYGK